MIDEIMNTLYKDPVWAPFVAGAVGGTVIDLGCNVYGKITKNPDYDPQVYAAQIKYGLGGSGAVAAFSVPLTRDFVPPELSLFALSFGLGLIFNDVAKNYIDDHLGNQNGDTPEEIYTKTVGGD